MELWTEYEGRTIDGAFPLQKLLLPEGRSAFFSTSNSKGEPTVIRLIASHFDEEEILARWRGVEALNHPNLLKLERYGQLILDDTTVVYAVIEPVDANLAEVIAQQRLNLQEARQLAASLAAALQVLHTNGFVHEHVEPSNIFAVGEVVKLRGDCIREAPEGEAGVNAKRRDLHDLAIVLLQALTQTTSLEAARREKSFPASFEQIIQNAINGTWGTQQILNALPKEPQPATTQHAKTGTASAAQSSLTQSSSAQPSAQPKPTSVPVPIVTATTNGHHATAQIPASAIPVTAVPTSAVPVSPSTPSQPAKPVPPATSFRPPFSTENDEEEPRSSSKIGLIAATAFFALLAIWWIWHASTRPKTASPAQAQSQPANLPSTVPHPAKRSAKPSAAGGGPNQTQIQKPAPPNNPAPTNSSSPAPAPLANHQPSATLEQWRVVAFTYNYRDQADKKAATISSKHSDLKAEVFTPTGRAPYLVTVGGAMTRDTAFAFAQKAKRLGLPRDTYAQNYKAQSQ